MIRTMNGGLQESITIGHQKEKIVFNERLLRRPVHFPAHIISEDKRYGGFIINISAYGLGMFIDTDVPESDIQCNEGSIIRVEFTSDLGQLIALQCKIIWLSTQERPQVGLTTGIGMEVIDPPPAFVKLFDRSL